MSDDSIGEEESVLVSCVEAFDRGDLAAIDRACVEHPEFAEQIRSTADVLRALRADAARYRERITRESSPPPNVERFELLRELGRGGTGIVYLARDRRLERSVALKTLPSSVAASPETLQRFAREWSALARIRHPHIASIHEVGETKEGLPFFTMDYVEGVSLDAILRRLKGKNPASLEASDLSPSAAAMGAAPSYAMVIVRLAAKLADALQHAHESGVVHRDVKPGNVLVDRAGEPILIDFGIARIADVVTLTRAGTTPGTPAYMAPELVSDRRVPPDRRVDVYGLGVTLYHLLTLRPPFDGVSTEQVFEQIRHREPPPLRHANPQVPRDLEAIVQKATEKDPSRRYATAAALRDDLLALLDLRPVEARPRGATTRMVRWVVNHRGRAAAIAAAAILIGIGVWRFQAFDAASREGERLLRKVAILKLALAQTDEEYSRATTRLAVSYDEASGGVVADLEEDVARQRFEVERALAGAEESFSEALRVVSWLQPLGTTKTVERQLADVRAIRRGESLVPGTVTFVVDAPAAEFHLFRYEPFRTRRRHTIPRSVPVPIAPDGTSIETGIEDFQPGDPCLVVTDVEPDGPLARAGIARGDLVYRIGAHAAGNGVFVRGVEPGSVSETRGVRPYARVTALPGKGVIRDLYDWETLTHRSVYVADRGPACRYEFEDVAGGAIDVELRRFP
ncbi:MAG: protein kinase [Planctomycetes bacterium]|nr:protein kinase [Planctomycetota bacterium]